MSAADIKNVRQRLEETGSTLEQSPSKQDPPKTGLSEVIDLDDDIEVTQIMHAKQS